jgi:hypothetical protein
MRNDFLIDTESACVVSDEVAVKIANCTRLHQPSSVERGAGFAAKKVGTDSLAKTRKLLDRAIVLAWKAVKSNRRPPALTPTRWVWRLAGAYHMCHPTEQLMKEAAQRFAADGRKTLAQWATQKAREEAGHDRLALLDIQSMGYDAEAVVKTLVPPAAAAFVDYFRRSVHSPDPIGCVGYAYALERIGICRGEKYIQAVEALLPQNTYATRALRVHSCVGAEVEHLERAIEMIAGLDPQECTRVAIACYETALLFFNPPKEGYISEQELQKMLKPLVLNKPKIASWRQAGGE